MSGSSGPIAPSAWRLSPLLSAADPLPKGELSPMGFPGWVMTNKRLQVLFQCIDTQKATALYLSDLSLDGKTPRLGNLRRLLRDGDTMPDGQTVQRVEACCLNNPGDVAARVMTGSGEHRIYVFRSGSEFETAVKFGDPVPGVDGGKFSQSLNDFELLDDGTLLVVGHYFSDDHPGQGLFHLSSGVGSLLSSSRQAIPNSAERIGVLGLIDVQGSSYTHQATAYGASSGNPTVVLQGDLSAPLVQPRMLAASGAIGLPNGVRARLLTADSHHGPRMTSSGKVATVVSQGERSRLVLEEQTLLESGARTPSGAQIVNFMSPLQGPGDSIFVNTLTASGGSELLLISGGGVRTVAADGATVGGRQVRRWGLGGVRRQTDGFRFVCSASYVDGSSGLVLGLPA